MRRISIYILLYSCLSIGFAACIVKKTNNNRETTTTTVENTGNSEGPIETTIVQYPSFPGGKKAMYAFIQKTKKYPESFGSLGVDGKVLVGFTVNEDGALSEIKVSKGIHPSVDEEALKVVKAMPKWNPGKEKGKPKAMTMQVAIDFYYLK